MDTPSQHDVDGTRARSSMRATPTTRSLRVRKHAPARRDSVRADATVGETSGTVGPFGCRAENRVV
jgi:hypothetical protein